MRRIAAATETAAHASVPVHMVAIADLYLASEAPKGIDLQVRDSGRGSPLTDAELKASLYDKGLIYAMIWKEHAGKKYVVAGNRRLKFLREIYADALATPVKTENIADYPGDWRDVAMDTNLALPPHLVERYEMIVRIAKDDKLSEHEVCARYGMSESQYRRVMALGKMAPVVRQAWKDSKIDARTAQAFTLEPDPKEQEKVFNRLVKAARQWRDEEGEDLKFRIDPHDVRGAIVPPSQQHAAQLIAFVGLEAVRAAKLLKQEDLFGGDHIVTDLRGLNKLVGDKMAAECKKLIDLGWSWAVRKEDLVEKEYQFGDVRPDAKGNFSEAQMKRSGCILKIGHAGELVVLYGKIKPAEKQKVAAAERREAAPAKPKKKSKPGEVALTNALAERLSASLEKAISEAMTAAPYVAVAGMIAGFASYGEIVNVDVGKRPNQAARYSGRGQSEKQFEQVFAGAMKASPEEKAVMLARVAAEALDIQVMNASSTQPYQNSALQKMIAALPAAAVNKALRENFAASDYFGSVGLDAIVEAVRSVLGEGHAVKVAKMKKADAAKFAAANLPAKGYLPPALRTAHYKGPIEKAPETRPASTTKKVAKKKKAKAKK